MRQTPLLPLNLVVPNRPGTATPWRDVETQTRLICVMNVDIERVRVLWRDLTGAPEGFRGAGVTVVGSAHHRAAPVSKVPICDQGVIGLGQFSPVVPSSTPPVTRYPLSGRYLRAMATASAT
jgi:hypothetical protein